MPTVTSSLDAEALTRARTLLKPPEPRRRTWPVLAAAGMLAGSALALATAMIMAPPLSSGHSYRGAGD